MLRSLLIVAAAFLSVSANSANALSPHPGFRQLNGCRALLHFKNINRTNYRTVILNCTSSVSYGQNLILLQEPVNDVLKSSTLDQSEAAMKQGPHRLARGRAVFEYAQKLAKERGWAFNWRKVETPDIGHFAAFMFAAKETEDALFGAK